MVNKLIQEKQKTLILDMNSESKNECPMAGIDFNGDPSPLSNSSECNQGVILCNDSSDMEASYLKMTAENRHTTMSKSRQI